MMLFAFHFGKGTKLSILPLAMNKYYGKLRSLTLCRQPVKENENSRFKLRLKIDLALHPAHGGGVG